MRMRIAGAVGTVVTCAAVGVLAQEPPGGGPPGCGPFGPREGRGGGGRGAMIERLLESPEIAEAAGITEEQQAMLRDARFESKTREIELRADLEKTGLEQARLMTEETVDEAAVLAAVEKAGALRTELAKLKIGQVLLVKKTLTPEQLKKLHETARQFKQHGRGEGKHDGKKRAEREGPPPEDEGM